MICVLVSSALLHFLQEVSLHIIVTKTITTGLEGDDRQNQFGCKFTFQQ